jgi:hypothetical protein
VKKSTTSRFVENGTVSDELPAFQAIRSHYRSDNAARIALSVQTAEGGNLVLLPGRSFGPFPNPALGFQFSADGTHWGFYVQQADRKFKVFSNTSGESDYDAVADFTMTPRGVAFVGTIGGKARVQVGTERHGPFDAAGLCADNERVHAAVVEAGQVAIRSY